MPPSGQLEKHGENQRKQKKTKNMFFLVFVLFTSRWSVRKVLACFSNWHLSAKINGHVFFCSCRTILSLFTVKSMFVHREFCKSRCGTVVPRRGTTVPPSGMTVPLRYFKNCSGTVKELLGKNGRIVREQTQKSPLYPEGGHREQL